MKYLKTFEAITLKFKIGDYVYLDEIDILIITYYDKNKNHIGDRNIIKPDLRGEIIDIDNSKDYKNYKIKGIDLYTNDTNIKTFYEEWFNEDGIIDKLRPHEIIEYKNFSKSCVIYDEKIHGLGENEIMINGERQQRPTRQVFIDEILKYIGDGFKKIIDIGDCTLIVTYLENLIDEDENQSIETFMNIIIDNIVIFFIDDGYTYSDVGKARLRKTEKLMKDIEENGSEKLSKIIPNFDEIWAKVEMERDAKKYNI
jgi:hypothetical protein